MNNLERSSWISFVEVNKNNWKILRCNMSIKVRYLHRCLDQIPEKLSKNKGNKGPGSKSDRRKLPRQMESTYNGLLVLGDAAWYFSKCCFLRSFTNIFIMYTSKSKLLKGIQSSCVPKPLSTSVLSSTTIKILSKTFTGNVQSQADSVIYWDIRA